jgi:hypothetical protein
MSKPDAAPAAQPAAQEPITVNDESTVVDLWAEIWRLREAVKGPQGYATWQDAATDERIRRVKAERALASHPPSVQEPSTERAEPQGLTVDLLDRAIGSVGAFCSDHGSSQEDFDTLDALLAARASAGKEADRG